MSSLLAAFRRAGADAPFGDPARDHGFAMEGYYCRVVHPRDAWVIVRLLRHLPQRGPVLGDGRAGRPSRRLP